MGIIDPSIPYRILPPPTQINPDDLPGGVNWQAKKAEAEAIKLKAQEQRQSFLDRQQLRAVLQKNGGDIEKSIPELSVINPELGMKLKNEWMGIQTKKQEFETARMSLWRDYEDHIAQANNPDEFAKALLAVPDAEFRQKYANAQWTPELKKAAEHASMAPAVREQRRIQATEAESREKDRLEDNKRQAQAEVNRHEEALARIKDMADDNARQQKQAEEANRHNRAMEGFAAVNAQASMLRASKAGQGGASKPRGVLSGDANRLSDMTTSLNDLEVLGKAIGGVGSTGVRSQIGAALPAWVTDLTGRGTEAKKKQALIDAVKQIVGKSLEGGVLRKEDEVKYEKILPTIKDTNEVVKSKLAGLRELIGQKRGTLVDSLDDAGYDVSRYRNRQGSTAPAPTTGSPKVGDVVMVKGQKVKITAIHSDGSFDGDPVK